jgi:hypothetical protein
MQRRLLNPTLRWRWLAMALVLATSLLSGCATPKPRTIEISKAQLQEIVNKRFPYQARWLDAIDVTATAPKLLLQPGSGMISAEITVSAADRMFGHSYRGSLLVESGLRYEMSDNSFRFSGVKVDKFNVEGLPTAYGPETARLGALLAEQLLENYAIYTLTSKQSDALKETGLKVSAMRISETGLSISLAPTL